MKLFDLLLNLSVPSFILLHLLVAPYTKVEESFNLQATHDLLNWDLTESSLQDFDHVTFSGAVPRTFVGAGVLAILAKPFLLVIGGQYGQIVVRGILGLLNAVALLKYKGGVERAFGRETGRWWVLLQGTQFHVVFYASRALPNMFAFGLTTLALREFLPVTGTNTAQKSKHLRAGIFLFVLAGVIFRAEIALLLFTHLLCLFFTYGLPVGVVTKMGISSAFVALAITMPIDTFFWQRPIWPEFAGFYFNAIEGKSTEWGTSPFLAYFQDFLPKLLLNPLVNYALIPMAFGIPALRDRALYLILPPVLFVAIYSIQPHKEARFIIYVVPSLTAVASVSASYIWARRSKTLLYKAGSALLVFSVLGSFVASIAMLLISSLNYPGGEALSKLQSLPSYTSRDNTRVNVHMDVLSCMTGVTLFNQHSQLHNLTWAYDKTENETTLLEPGFWEQFDYLLMAEPGEAIGAWEVVDTIYSYDGVEVLRPGQKSALENPVETLYVANNVTKEKDGDEVVMSSEDVREGVGDILFLAGGNEKAGLSDRIKSLTSGNLTGSEVYFLFRDSVRVFTGGWWIGPRMAPAIKILRRA